jgi:thioredoxin 1
MSKKILKFAASWCQPCKMLSKTIAGMEIETQIEEIDIDEQEELAIQYQIRSVPTLVMLDDDKEVKRVTGMQSSTQLEAWING